LLHHPSATQKELSEFAQISAGTINWHMKRLVSSTLIRQRGEGQFVRYEVNGDREEMMNLAKGYHPNTLLSWADRFANAINEASPEVNLEHKKKLKKEESKEEN
jgi:hypothetical protein